jgi:hypothetical protein
VFARIGKTRELRKGISVSISALESKYGLTSRNCTVGIREVVQRYVLNPPQFSSGLVGPRRASPETHLSRIILPNPPQSSPGLARNTPLPNHPPESLSGLVTAAGNWGFATRLPGRVCEHA